MFVCKELAISPNGNLHLISSRRGEKFYTSKEYLKIINDFTACTEKALLSLAAIEDDAVLKCPIIKYWRNFSIIYFNKFCCSSVSGQLKKITITEQDLLNFELNIPPISGYEYFSIETIKRIWINLDNWVKENVISFDDGARGFISKYLPLWQQVGKICFHLAENKADKQRPFAFLITYAPNINKKSKVQYQPLSQALQQYANNDDTEILTKLLKPIYNASQKLPWLSKIVDNGDIYHPLAWTIQEAYNMLRDASNLENFGILLRLPNWWKKRQRPQVQIVIGDKKRNVLNANSLLDFEVNVVLGDNKLTAKELKEILDSKYNIVTIKGKWVEVDADKLKNTLEHWQAAKDNLKDEGLSFLGGMRLLAGVNENLTDFQEEHDNKEWFSVEAGKWLGSKLENLRSPDAIGQIKPGKELLAKLRPYQQIGVNWLHFLTELRLGACLADDMGLGKTIQIIALLIIKKRQLKNNVPSLLILPASLLSNWKSELIKFAPSLQAVYLHGSEMATYELENIAVNPKQYLEKIDIVLTTYGMLLRQSWLKEYKWNLVILDEAQAIKNPAARQTKAIKLLNSQSRIALTGTPIENRLGDLWSLFDYLLPSLLGTANEFKKFIKQLSSQDISYSSLRRLVQPYILRRLKTDRTIIADLPDKTELISWCSLSKLQTKLYMQAVNELKKALEEEEPIKRRGIVLAYLLYFKQICNHPSQWLGSGNYKEKDSGKFIRLREICEEIAIKQEKVLIFTQFKEIIPFLENFLKEIFNAPGLMLHGGTAVKKRQQLVDKFQNEQSSPFFILSLKAAGIGLNLTAANHVIHFDRWWNPAVENQATDRAFRIGQHKNVLVHKFACRGTIEEKISALILEKNKLADNILGGQSGILLTEMSNEELLNFVTLNLEKAVF